MNNSPRFIASNSLKERKKKELNLINFSLTLTMINKKQQQEETSVLLCWANLPPELLDKIFALLSLSDRNRFRLVCSPWRGVAKLSGPPSPFPFGPPRLLLTRPDGSVFFFDVFRSKSMSCNSLLPSSFRRSRCLGYLAGWFFMVSEQSSSRACLLNPVLLVEIPLPDLEFPIEKAVLSVPPGFANCVVAVMGRSNLIALCEPAGKRWLVLDLGYHSFEDIVFWRNKLCLIENYRGNVLICNFDMESRTTSMLTVRLPGTDPYRKTMFLVESTGSDLLAVAYSNWYARFWVYKLNHDCTWEHMELIGDQALFLGAIRSESVPVNRFLGSGLRENSIYWTSKNSSRSTHGVVTVYSMEDNVASVVPVSERYSILADPVWVSPVIWP